MRWSEFKAKWKDCRECSLREDRAKVVLARGKIPCDVLLVGEAPGDVENVQGLPFVGPAGILLQQVISHYWKDDLRYLLTNLVCCVPRKEDDEGFATGDIRQPTAKEVKACRPRLLELIAMAKPKAVVAVGSTANTHLRKFPIGTLPDRLYSVAHPSGILQASEPQRSIAIQQFEIRMKTIGEECSRHDREVCN